ncbi:hypothetical protein L195_g043887, partial [Trifolium pratense]
RLAAQEKEGVAVVDSQPLAQVLWETQVHDGFKAPHLPSFDGKTDPVEHLMAVGSQTAIVNAPEHLKCKLLSGTFKDAALRWYMNLPRNSIESYADFHKKFIHQFAGSTHVKVTSTSLFSIHQAYAESLREYLARFSETTIKVSNPNQEMFVTTFPNGLRAGHFNESLAQKPTTSMQEINKRAECYIKGEESNAEKRMRDAKEKKHVSRRIKSPDHHPQRQSSFQESSWQERHKKPYQYPQDRGILSTGMTTLQPTRGKPIMLGPNSNAWCAYHRAKGHDTEMYFRLRDLIEELIRSGHLRKFIDDAAQGRVVVPKVLSQDSKEPSGRDV